MIGGQGREQDGSGEPSAADRMPGGGAPGQGGGAPGQGGGAPGQGGGSPRSRRRMAVAASVAVVVVVAGVTAFVTTGSPGHATPAAAGPRPTATPTQASLPTALKVTSISPASRSRGVNGSDPVTVTFSAPVAADSPLPRLVPSVRGSWRRSGDQLVFAPVMPFTPGTRVTLRIPGGTAGVQSAAGGRLASGVVAHFRTRGWSTRRLEQILAQLRYLPLVWKPRPAASAASSATSGTGGTAATGMAAQLAAMYAPPHGRFVWRSGYPSSLTSQWSVRNPGVILRGALMAFQSVHGLPMTGTTSRALWEAVVRAMALDQRNPNGYSYALASKVLPETLTVWHNGAVVMHGLANTGIPASPTADGTFPVYLRYRNQIMRGVNPNGTHYADPVQYVSYFNGGDAVHQYYRASYGFPQSLGCVELPLNEAATVWPYLTYGTLVTVTG